MAYCEQEHIAGHALNRHNKGVREGEPVALFLGLHLMGESREGRVLLLFPQGFESHIVVIHKLGVLAQVLALRTKTLKGKKVNSREEREGGGGNKSAPVR